MNNKKIRKKGSWDAESRNNERIQIKFCIDKNNELSSFNSNSNFDKLILFSLNLKENKAEIYEISNIQQIKDLKVNKNETFQEQQNQKRKPRFSIFKSIIKPQNIKPKFIIDLKHI